MLKIENAFQRVADKILAGQQNLTKVEHFQLLTSTYYGTCANGHEAIRQHSHHFLGGSLNGLQLRKTSKSDSKNQGLYIGTKTAKYPIAFLPVRVCKCKFGSNGSEWKARIGASLELNRDTANFSYQTDFPNTPQYHYRQSYALWQITRIDLLIFRSLAGTTA